MVVGRKVPPGGDTIHSLVARESSLLQGERVIGHPTVDA